MQCKWTLTKRFRHSTKFVGVGAGNFLGMQRISFPNFPNFPEELLYDERSPCKLSVAIGTLPFYFHIAIDWKKENLVLKI